MPTFKLDQRIPSCSVTKDLLSEIEAYLNIEMPKKICEALGEQISYNISITEKVGTETLVSISQYTPRIFPDRTKEIEIHWGNGYKATCRLEITIDFRGDRFFSGRLQVRCTNPSARETAVGIGNNILRLIESHQTYNWVFDPAKQSVVPFFSLILSVGLVSGSFPIFMKNSKVGLWLLTAAAFFGWILFSGMYFRPFISFDTRRQQLLNRLWVYFSLGILGFVIYGTFLPLLRKAIVGF